MKKWVFICLALFSLTMMGQQQQEPPKLKTLYKTARLALKTRANQPAAKQGLLGALTRPELSNKDKCKIYYTAAELDESSNSLINQQAFLKQKYDSAALFNTVLSIYDNLILCDSVDIIPNANGNVKLKYRGRTRDMMLKHRRNLLTGGVFFLKKSDWASAYRYFDNYLRTNGNPSDTLLPKVYYWATLCGHKLKDAPKILKYVDQAIEGTDSATKPVLQEYKCRSYQTLGNEKMWLQELHAGIYKYPNHDYFFVNLLDYYNQHSQFDEGLALADSLLHIHRDKPLYWYAKCLLSLNKEDYDNCIAYSDSCINLDANYADAYYNKSISYCNKALYAQEALKGKNQLDESLVEERKKIKELYLLARSPMEKVRQLQPENLTRWAQPLYRIYLYLNMGDEFDEIDKLLKANAQEQKK
ncbi:MAG: hypothetical protein J5661_06440 [Bacteroidaceae bacterium]|nr:hypothetical protein [Bacteroidaceae bacterium]